MWLLNVEPHSQSREELWTWVAVRHDIYLGLIDCLFIRRGLGLGF